MSQDQRLRIIINGQPLEVEKGITILQAARQHGIEIPTLCDFPGLPSTGRCRMCIVEIQGWQNTPTACTTPAAEGMVIDTHSPKVKALRAELIQLLLAEHPSGCLFCPEKDHCDECMVTLRKSGVTTGCGSCPKDQQCELQRLAEQYDVAQPGYPIRYRMLPVKKHDPFFDRDDNLCILCGRCVRVCESLHFASSLALTRRGTHALVGAAFQRTHVEAGCTFCGSCVEVCPTGALSEKTRKWDGKPEREISSTCSLCSIGCQITLLAKNERVLGSLPDRGAGTDLVCVKGRFGITELVNHPSRLTHPQKRADLTFQEVGWAEAIETAAEKLATCSPERFGLRISVSATVEDLFVASQFAKRVMKSGNIRTSAQARYGPGSDSFSRLLLKSTPLEDLDSTPVILCLGLEDPYALPVVEAHLNQAKKNGAKLIQLGSRRLSWTRFMDEWLQTEEGQEVDLIQELGQWIIHVQPAGQSGSQETLARAAQLLRQAPSPVVILGPAVFGRPVSRILLHSIETLVQNLDARVILLPEPANLVGALRLGLCSAEPETADLDVLYLIGEAVPTHLAGDPFILYQNLYPPQTDTRVDLLLPSAAFTESEGRLINYAGQVKNVHPAVQPPGTALPSWLILARIAQKMGAADFAYSCSEDVWREIEAEFPGFPQASSSALPQPEGCVQGLCEPFANHSYLGFPLVEWVGGLRSLYPEMVKRSAHDPNS